MAFHGISIEDGFLTMIIVTIFIYILARMLEEKEKKDNLLKQLLEEKKNGHRKMQQLQRGSKLQQKSVHKRAS